MKLNRQFIKFFWGMVICTVLALSYPSTEVWAEEEKTVLDITQGSVYIDENEITGKDPLGNDVTETDPDGYIIKGNGVSTSNTIYISASTEVVLDNVNISTGTSAPIEIRDYNDINVTLILSGSNYLTSTGDNIAAIHKSRGQQADNNSAGTLTIDGTGSLTAAGGYNAAGIGGGGYNGDVHNITINGGSIFATGGGDAAGIGASCGGSIWKLFINGGYVVSNGAYGIGSATDSYMGVHDSNITGGMVITNYYRGNAPTGGMVSTDGGKSYTVYNDHVLEQNLIIESDAELRVSDGKTLTVHSEKILVNLGKIINYGEIIGSVSNYGDIYNMGTLPDGTGQNIYEQYVKVNGGTGSGQYEKDAVVEITASAPEKGKKFTGWTVELGEITLTNSEELTTTFTMPEECVIVRANYQDIVAAITDSDGNVTSFTDVIEAMFTWREMGGTLNIFKDCDGDHLEVPADGVLDLNGNTVEFFAMHISNSCTIQNGTILVHAHADIAGNSVVTFKNVTISSELECHIINNGTIVEMGLTLENMTADGLFKRGLTEDDITLSGIPVGGYIYDGNAHEPEVKYGDISLVKDYDYTVTFSNSNGGTDIIKAGTITMTITGVDRYVGVVTKTYEILKSGLDKGNDGKWYYYTNGEVDVSRTGMVQHEDELWYVKSGEFYDTYTGLVLYRGKCIYVKSGKYDSTYTGLAKNASGIWYIKNGEFDITYTGTVKNASGIWYIKEGKLDITYTGLALYKGKCIYIKLGKFDSTYTGTASNAAGVWYMKDGVLDMTYTGLVKDAYGIWYMKEGKLDTTYTGLVRNAYGVWYISNGRLVTTYTGLATNAYGTWYIKNGKFDISYSGEFEFNGKTYTIENGKVV